MVQFALPFVAGALRWIVHSEPLNEFASILHRVLSAVHGHRCLVKDLESCEENTKLTVFLTAQRVQHTCNGKWRCKSECTLNSAVVPIINVWKEPESCVN